MSRKNSDRITIHEPADFEGMRKAGKLAAEVLDYITDYVDVGVSTEYLDNLCNEYIKSKGAISACKNYHGYRVFLSLSG